MSKVNVSKVQTLLILTKFSHFCAIIENKYSTELTKRNRASSNPLVLVVLGFKGQCPRRFFKSNFAVVYQLVGLPGTKSPRICPCSNTNTNMACLNSPWLALIDQTIMASANFINNYQNNHDFGKCYK